MKNKRKFFTGAGASPSENFEVETKICAILGFAWKKYFSAIIDFHFPENPRFRDKFQALIDTVLMFIYLNNKCTATSKCLRAIYTNENYDNEVING